MQSDKQEPSTMKAQSALKVKDLLLRYRTDSNASVVVKNVRTGETAILSPDDIKSFKYKDIMDSFADSFDIIDKVFTIYAFE